MAARKKNMLFPLVLLAMLLIIVSQEGKTTMVGGEQCDAIRDTLCPDLSKSFIICIHSGNCNKCCQEKGYVHGSCSFLTCKCCK